MRARAVHHGRRATFTAGAVSLLLCVAALQCSRAPTAPSPGGPSTPGIPNNPNTPLPTPATSEIFAGAGDIAICPGASEATASLLDGIGGLVFTLGDNAYPNGAAQDFGCYDRSWGRHKGRTRPAPGNHDYRTPGAAAYFSYFGDLAGVPGQGYYSFPLGAWHIISLNSNYDPREGGIPVGAGSPQAMWLRADLAANPRKCTLAYWHHPLFSSGRNGDNPQLRDLYRILYDAGADLVLTGHDHSYERFAPQDADGRNDSARGIRQFVVGTGGVEAYPFAMRRPNSEVQVTGVVGVLKLTLNPDNYQFEFITTSGIRDNGSGVCH